MLILMNDKDISIMHKDVVIILYGYILIIILNFMAINFKFSLQLGVERSYAILLPYKFEIKYKS